MNWGSKTQIMTSQTVAGTEIFSSSVDLDGGNYDVAWVEIEIDPPATPTDEITASLYATLDSSSENWDDTPFLQFNIANSIDPNKVGFLIKYCPKFRIGVVRDGSTDSFTVDIYYKAGAA